MSEPSPLLHWLPLAHHNPAEAERCFQVRLPLVRRRLAICSRCSGLYPALAGAIVLQAALNARALGPADFWVSLVGIGPALVDWGLSWIGRRRGGNLLRFATGAVLGIALGRSIWLYFRDARSEVFWVQMGLLVAGALAFHFVRVLRL